MNKRDDRICPICGKPFSPSHHAKKTCSEPCRREFNRIRDKNYRNAIYRADPDINRRKYQNLIDQASADPALMAETLKKREEQRAKVIEKRDSDPINRAQYLLRERIRNAFRGDYLDQKKITWRQSMPAAEREKWRRYNRDWRRNKRLGKAK